MCSTAAGVAWSARSTSSGRREAVLRLRLHPYRLPLRRPWVAASVTLTERRGWLIEATGEDGTTGWGDCAPLPSTGAAGCERAFAALSRLAGTGAALPGDPPEVRWALETAQFDLEARQHGVPLARLLGAGELTVPVNAALGPLDAACAGRAAEAAAQGYRYGKIKVGIDSVDRELARLRDLAERLDGRLRLRLDANRAWIAADARRFLTAVADLPIDGVEEPLAAPTCAALAALQADLPFALAADESLPVLGIDALLAANAVRRLVIKPARIGGIAATLALAETARRAGVDVVLTSVVDSAVGVAAAAHLAARLGGPAHGLATGSWLAADVAPAPPIVAGRLRLPDAPGLGVIPDPARMGALI